MAAIDDTNASKNSHPKRNPSHIRNKMKRAEVMAKYKKEKKELKEGNRRKRQREAKELGDEAPPKQIPRTLDNTREPEITTVSVEDKEIMIDEAEDEFAKHFSNEIAPKLMITTRPKPSGELYHFIGDLITMIPNAYYYKRGSYDIKDICKYATSKNFTHVIVLSEKAKECNGALISHLPNGPTAFFKVSNVKTGKSIENHGKRTSHIPEIILNNFSTRLGHRIGRFLGSLFPHIPNFKGRQVVTFHNQRDYLFVRQHRYVFENDKKARLQEIGPQFTLKLRWLQEGTFDTKYGEYEWKHRRREMDTTRRRFHL